MVDYVTRCKLTVNVLYCYAHLNHKHHCVISKVSKLVNGFCFIVGFTCDYNLGALLTNFFKYFIDTFFKKIGCSEKSCNSSLCQTSFVKQESVPL